MRREQRLPKDAKVVLETEDWTIYYSAFAKRFIFYTNDYNPVALGLSPAMLSELLRISENSGESVGDGNFQRENVFV